MHSEAGRLVAMLPKKASNLKGVTALCTAHVTALETQVAPQVTLNCEVCNGCFYGARNGSRNAGGGAARDARLLDPHLVAREPPVDRAMAPTSSRGGLVLA